MAEVSAAAVKKLRDQTDMPMMMCKQALSEAGGDMDKAFDILKEKASTKLKKRDDNATEEGKIFLEIAADGSKASMVEVQCESAPVAGSEALARLGNALVHQLLTGPGAASGEELMKQPGPDGKTLADLYTEVSSKIQEKIVVSRVARLDAPVGTYVHHDGKTAVLFQATTAPKNADILKDIAMHIAAMRPLVTNVADLDPAVVQAERDRLSAEAAASGKPANVIEKMVEGRLKGFYRDDAGVLVEQPFAKDDKKSVGQILEENGSAAKNFVAMRLGK
ncbi:MAG: translation elongation factor Ts [Planctomycetaceae bacterium]